MRKLADVHLDLGNIDAAEPLIGALIGHEPDVESLKVRARFAFPRDDAKQAVELMSQAKERAGEHWAANSEAVFRQHRDALNIAAGWPSPPTG